ncbi:MAG: hypothetical protein WC997_02330 [Porticoccaceae bacterium]
MSELFTPGRWYPKTDNFEPGFSSIVLNDKRAGWVMRIQHNGEAIEARQQADLALVAAAPDLYRALKDCVDLIDVLSPLEGDTVRKARVALALARGWW